jgi:predicted Zn-dependent protease
MGLVKEARVIGYLRNHGARPIRGSAAQDDDWMFGVLDDNALNAFSPPACYVYVSAG